jgi:hypothetical protein
MRAAALKCAATVYKNCNFEPFCYVIKSVLLKREEEKRFL